MADLDQPDRVLIGGQDQDLPETRSGEADGRRPLWATPTESVSGLWAGRFFFFGLKR